MNSTRKVHVFYLQELKAALPPPPNDDEVPEDVPPLDPKDPNPGLC